ncbi:MAG: malto-oligosyltrehalose trehalohydrolase [Deltaproteobacteria bacterium]|nr:malto-oligosyltrehalose trehalohydrolase [Deltaproteobacteria bacterium]
MSPRRFRLERGATVVPGGVRFSVWAPRARSVAVVLSRRPDHPVELTAHPDGSFSVVTSAEAGDDYRYLLDGQRLLPDPVSRHQPEGVHGVSRVVDPRAYRWQSQGWRGLALADYVFYELHVGTFTPEGSFDGAIAHLDALVELGITAVELMPVAAFPGARNWGYDGVGLFAPHHDYGGPEGLRRLVDACHQRGLAVVLDVVYNHLGPEGNYLGAYGPYFSPRYHTPWGDALNYDGPDSDEVRRFVLDNARTWIDEFQIDALRLDAVHGIFDASAWHLLAELSACVRAEATARGRKLHLIAESDLNDVRVIAAPARGGHDLDAQWSDDFHHATHAVLTGDRAGYFGDFGKVEDLAAAYTRGFVHDGRPSAYRRRRHGASLGDEPGSKLVVYLQNHDQIANASQGRRLGARVPPAVERLAAFLLVCAPNLPMLFMGQEWSASSPFLYFTSHGDAALAAAVTEGRRREHEVFGAAADAPFVAPQSLAALERSRLDWSERERPGHIELVALYRELLALRRRTPALRDGRRDLISASFGEEPRWLQIDRGGGALLLVNFEADQPVQVTVAPPRQPLRLWAASDERRWGGQGPGLTGPTPPTAREASATTPPHLLAAGVATTVTCPARVALLYLPESR